ncbi:MAG: NAD/FAD-binding protein, partial [Rhodospirillales bacterium]|nr:NAD/FAD-binding protein [Rhodospirillales bacterium]
SLDNRHPLFVSVNPVREPNPTTVHRSFDYQHPFFDLASWNAQKDLWQLQGTRNTWFCGSYFGAGFHEDALQSGLAVAEELGGVKRPWQVKNESARIYRGVSKKDLAA